ncbi:MAG: Asp23/Gls24 family envelope stress response protein [Oscillospiraceae bacterium]|nr:Asp23/Gls24 family envelope stress response protein [Oscillospiraceae bacterium]
MVKYNATRGEIVILSDVITTLAGAAATNCFGVKGMAKRSMSDGLVHLLKREAMGKGVLVTYGPEDEISIELHIIVDYGVNIAALTESIIGEVRYKVESAISRKIHTVSVFVDAMMVD